MLKDIIKRHPGFCQPAAKPHAQLRIVARSWEFPTPAGEATT